MHLIQRGHLSMHMLGTLEVRQTVLGTSAAVCRITAALPAYRTALNALGVFRLLVLSLYLSTVNSFLTIS